MLGSGQKIAFLGYRWGIVGVSLNPVGNSVNSSIYNIMFFGGIHYNPYISYIIYM